MIMIMIMKINATKCVQRYGVVVTSFAVIVAYNIKNIRGNNMRMMDIKH
jgi:hypothetical protein